MKVYIVCLEDPKHTARTLHCGPFRDRSEAERCVTAWAEQGRVAWIWIKVEDDEVTP